MSNPNDNLTEVANAFDRDPDPLQQFEGTFEGLDVDPFKEYRKRVLIPNGASKSTRDNYEYTFDHWKEFMQSTDRHPACPNDTHVKDFMMYLAEEHDNESSSILKKVNNLKRTYEWWQEHHAFPHPLDYNPFKIAKRETNLGADTDEKKHPPVTRQELSSVVRGCKNIRERFFIVWPLKLGLRAGELLNLRIEEIALSHAEIEKLYPEMGTADPIKEYDDVVYIPSRYRREGNKSHNPRILPLDDELKRVLLQFLATRPMVDSSWLILSQRTFGKIERSDRVNQVWRDYFSEYNEVEQYRDITSHFGRYYFTNYWKVQENLPRELVQYMRGDKLGDNSGSESIDDYLTAYYEDIKDVYLNRVFKVL